MKKTLMAGVILLIASLLLVTGCQKKTEANATTNTKTIATSSRTVDTVSRPSFKTFNDSVGRTVEIPGTFNKIVAASPAAQLYLYAIAPEKLIGLAEPWPEESSLFFEKRVYELPVYGAFDIWNSTLQADPIKESGADLVLILGQAGENAGGISYQLDMLQDRIGIPVIFIENSFDGTLNLVTKIAKLISAETSAVPVEKLASKIMEPVNQSREMFTVYYSGSSDGLTPVLPGAEDFEVFNYMGISNAVPSDFTGGYEIDGIVALNPDMIFLADRDAYEFAISSDEWKEVPCVAEGKIFLVPDAPMNLLSDPNSIQRLLGLEWLRMTTYGSVSSAELMSIASDFYRAIFHADLTSEQIKSWLNL